MPSSSQNYDRTQWEIVKHEHTSVLEIKNFSLLGSINTVSETQFVGSVFSLGGHVQSKW